MADVVNSALGTLGSAVLGKSADAVPGTGLSGWWMVGVGIFIGVAVLSIVGAVIYFYWYEKKQWRITTRVHYENPAIKGITIGGGVKTKRVRFKDGKVVYMYKTPIQGYTISPELLTWTRPLEHDVIVTQDKKLFTINGIDSIDVQRKMLKVDVSYPDIEMDRQDLQHHIDSKKFDDPNDRLKMILKTASYVFIGIILIVAIVLGGKYWIDAKNIDANRDQTNLQTAKYQTAVMNQMNTFIAIMTRVMPQSFSQIDNQNLLNQTT